MDIAATASVQPSTTVSAAGLSPADEAAVFDQMVKSIVTGGMSLMNSLVGDVITELGEPIGDPDQ